MQFNKLLKDILPPIITRNIKRLRGEKYGWIGKYKEWDYVKSITKGYDSNLILNLVFNSLTKVKNGEYAFERDGGLFSTIQYSYPLLSALLWIASNNNNKLNLIDFGGSLGSSYYQNVRLLSHIDEIKWNIVEQPNFVSLGKEHFENEILKFYYDIETASQVTKANTLLLLGVIEYIEKPYELINKINLLNFKYIIIDRTPFSNCKYDFICKQVVPSKDFESSYPCWIFDKEKMLSAFSERYEEVYDFSSNFGKFKISNHIIEHRGVFLKSK